MPWAITYNIDTYDSEIAVQACLQSKIGDYLFIYSVTCNWIFVRPLQKSSYSNVTAMSVTSVTAPGSMSDAVKWGGTGIRTRPLPLTGAQRPHLAACQTL